MANLSIWFRSAFFSLTIGWFVFQGMASGQEANPTQLQDMERRIRELEKVVQDLRGQNIKGNVTPAGANNRAKLGEPAASTLPEAVVSPSTPSAWLGASPFTAGWKNGFIIQSPEKDFSLRITGQIQSDYRGFLNRNNQDTTDIDTFQVRRARLGIEATVFQYYEFRLLPDFGQGQSRIQDSYLNIHYWDALQFQIGKFKEPVSYEQLIQDRFVPTLERSMIDQIVPARDVGAMIHGQKLLGNRLDYAFGLFNGEINGDTDTNNHVDFAWRVAVRPFQGEFFLPILRGLQVGVSGTTGAEQEPISPNILRTPASVPWFQFNSTVRADGLRNRLTPEVSYFYRSLGFATQYIHLDQTMRASAVAQDAVNIPMNGYYVMATYLLTGEERTTYSQAVMPNRPFNPLHPLLEPGAWEFVARISRLQVGQDVFAQGVNNLADPTKYSSAAKELTVGFNWYLNGWVRTQFNWEHAWFEQPVRLGAPGPVGLLNHQDTLYVRLQVIF